MKNQTHTPGPWNCEPAAVRGFKVFIGPRNAANDVLLIGSSGGNLETITQDKANAHLIAACPELFAAARLLATLTVTTCDRCNGTGEQPHAHQDACHTCGGTGKEVETPEPCDVEQAIAAISKSTAS